MQIVKADAPVTATPVPFKEKSVRGKLGALLPWVVFGCACVLLVVGCCVHYGDGLDDDMASELVLAKMLSEGKGFIITNQWFYSTEIRFLNTQLIFAPLFWLFKSWAVVRIVGTVILHALMLGAFYFLLASLQQKRLFPWLATLLILPLSFHQALIVNFGAYYLPHLAIAFTVLGLLFYAGRVGISRRRWWLLVGGGALLSCLSAIGGCRLVVLLNVPLFLAAVFDWLNNLRTVHPTGLKFLAGSGLALVAAGVGFGVNVLLHHWFVFATWDTLAWQNWSWSGLPKAVNTLLVLFGWRADHGVFSMTTIGNVVAVVLLVLFIVATVDIIKHRDRYNPSVVRLTWFVLSALMIFTLIYVTTTMPLIERFALPFVAMILPVVGAYFVNQGAWQVVSAKWRVGLKTLMGGVVMVLALANGLLMTTEFYFTNQYPWHNYVENTSMRTVAAQLIDADCTQGYFYSHAVHCVGGNVLTEFSNGAIEVWKLSAGATSLDATDNWLQAVSHTQTHPAGKVFFMVNNLNSNDPLPTALMADATDHRFYSDQYFTVYVYASWDELNALVA